MLDHARTLSLHQGEEKITILLSPSTAEALQLTDDSNTPLSLLPIESSAPGKLGALQTSVGVLDNVEDDHIVRAVAAPVDRSVKICNATSVRAIGLLSYRFRQNRITGGVPADCPWPTRMAFVHTLRQLSEAGVNWSNGEYTALGSIIRKATGRTLTREEFDRAVRATFGDIKTAVDQWCPFAEITQYPALCVESNDEWRMLGVRFIIQESDGHPKRLSGNAAGLTFKGARTGVHSGEIIISFLTWPADEQLRQYRLELVDEHASDPPVASE